MHPGSVSHLIENSRDKSHRIPFKVPDTIKTPPPARKIYSVVDRAAQGMQYSSSILSWGRSEMAFKNLESNTKLIIIGVAAVLGLVFILQNFEQTSFQFLIWTLFSGPKWIVISFFFMLGLAFGYLLARKRA